MKQEQEEKIKKEQEIVEHIKHAIWSHNIVNESDDDDSCDSEEDTRPKDKKTSGSFEKWYKKCLDRFMSDVESHRSCTDRFIISLDSKLYQFWKIFVIISSIVSSYLYAFEGAFYIPEPGSVLGRIDFSFEVIFALDMVVRKYLIVYNANYIFN